MNLIIGAAQINTGMLLACSHLIPKMKIVAQISKPTSQEDIARGLGMTRQAVDKHLKDFVKYVIVERMWITGVRKPRIEFQTSMLGSYFYENLRTFIREFRNIGKQDFGERLKSLDMRLMKDEMGMARYDELRKELESERL